MIQRPETTERPDGVDHLPGRDLHYVRLGSGRAGTVLFLHGITESRRYFAGKVRPLADRFELLIPDLPGFGLSPKPATRYSMDLFRGSVRSFLEHHGLHERPIHIVGHSLGSLIALEYAGRHPENVERLVLLSLPRHFSRAEAHRIFWRGSPSYRKLLQEHSIRETVEQVRRMGVSMSLRLARHIPWTVVADARKFTFLSLTSTLENCLLNYRVDPALDRMPHRPTLLVHGEQDQVAPFEHVRPLPGMYPWMRLVTVPESGHHMLHTHAKQVVRAMKRFLLSDSPE